jgi:hypothetical protein
MTDPKLEVGEAAARAPRLEHADVLLIERELDELERRCADVDDPQPLMTRLWAGKAIQQLRAARAPREPLEPQLRAAVAELCVAVRGSGDMPYSWFPAIAKLLALEDEGALAAARSALPPPTEALYDATMAEMAAQLRPQDVINRCVDHPNATQELVCAQCIAESDDEESAALPRAPEPDLAREFWMNLSADKLTALLDYKRFGSDEDAIRLLDHALRAARAGAEAPPPEEPK